MTVKDKVVPNIVGVDIGCGRYTVNLGKGDTKRLERSFGTLGGGNHFIEVDRAQDGTNYLVIHTGSRNLGKQVAKLYQ